MIRISKSYTRQRAGQASDREVVCPGSRDLLAIAGLISLVGYEDTFRDTSPAEGLSLFAVEVGHLFGAVARARDGTLGRHGFEGRDVDR